MNRPRTPPLLFEIGCEEIPARFLTDAQSALGKALEEALAEARLLPDRASPTETFSTPRRLSARVRAVLERQPDQVEQVLGPPVRIGLDINGKPTRAAESFAAKYHASLTELVAVETARGEYLALRKRTVGRPAQELLSQILPQVIAALSFPRNMYWRGKAGPRFVRPIRWLLAVLGEGREARVVPFDFAGINAGDTTYGHRAAGGKSVPVRGFDEYKRRLRDLRVEIDPRRRKETILEQSKVLLEELAANVVKDERLEEWIVNSCEWPTALMGSFHEQFLDLPREILITVMRDHQKYFAVEDRRAKLLAKFVAVLNGEGDPKGWIRRGHERVLAARFSDARFFWQADQRTPLRDRLGLLARVTFEAELGSYAEKVERMTSLAREISRALEERRQLDPRGTEHALRAVELSKCDLTTQMVQEFPELQGVVGGIYARTQGEPPEVAEAIYDHYMPQGLDDRLPRSVIGAVVSLADKLDSLAGGFAVGHEPSGSSDPFGMRRQGNAIVKVLLENLIPIALKPLIELALVRLRVKWQKPRDEVFHSLVQFLEERVRYYLETVRGFRYDTVRAVAAAGWDPSLDALARAEALESLRGSEDLEAVCAAAKRIKNILNKSAAGEGEDQDTVDPSLLIEAPEKALFEAWKVAQDRESNSREKRDYRTAFAAIAGLRPTVDKFFDKVLVMAEDQKVRRNRLRLLRLLDGLFSAMAHFAEIAPSIGANVDASTSTAVTSNE